MNWPPLLADLKEDAKVPVDETRDDVDLQRELDASVSFVERVRRGDFNFSQDPLSPLPEPTEDLTLGTLRLAGRWFTRRRSPDGLVALPEVGSSRVPSFDPDIERQLGIGRFRKAQTA